MFKKNTSNGSKHSAFWISLPIFAITFLVLYFIVNLTNFSTFIDKMNAILSPIFIGLVIAYLMNPIFKFFENKVFRWEKDTSIKRRLCRLFSLICTLIVFFAIIALLILLIVPQLIDSIVEIVTNHEHYINTLIDFINNLANSIMNNFSYDENRQIISYDSVHNAIHKFFESGENEEGKNLAILFQKYSQQISTVGSSVFTFLKDFIIGIFIAFYILASKELRGAQIKKLRRAMLTREQNKFVSEALFITKTSFGGYIRGKLLSSFAVGLLTYICLLIFNISDYKLLIATIIGVTDIIPVFGPFIGAIPSAIIVLMCDPTKLLPFILIIFIIQQIEGNIITPKILGESTNISSLAVIISISTMGGLFGIVGMLVGVPVFATIIILTKRYLEKRLKAKDLPTETEDYMGENSMSDTDVILHKQDGIWINKIKQSIKERKEKKANKSNPPEAAPQEDEHTDAPDAAVDENTKSPADGQTEGNS